MERVAIYTRVSTKRQVDKYSPQEQVRILTEFAQSKGWEIYDYYSDLGESGAESDREDLDRLLIDAGKKHFNRVLLFEQDRLSRLEQIEWAYLANSMAKLGIKLVTPTSEINLDNEEDRFLADLFNLLANRELKKTKKRTSMGRRAAHREGKFFGREAPFGVSYNNDTKKFKAIPEEVAIIKRMYELYKGGESFNSISRTLNSLGYRGRLGGHFNSSQIRKIMLNPIHSGYFEQTVLGETLIHKVDWEEGDSPYISQDEYEVIKKIANDRSATSSGKYFHKPIYLLVGLLVCNECGKKMAALANGSKLANGEIKRYPAYAHRDALKTCRCRYRMNEIDERVVSKLQEIAGNPDALIQSTNNSPSENPEDLKAQLENISSERKKIMDRKNKLLDLYMDGKWSKEELEYKKKELDVALSELGKREEDINKKLVAVTTPDIDYERIALDCLVFKEFGKILLVRERIELLRKFVHEVRVSKNGEIEIYLYANDGKIICAKCM